MSTILTERAADAALTVSALNRQVRILLEQNIARLWVEGEISNLARPASGHIYFSLKDESAQIRCAWFHQRQRGSRARLQNGDKMLVLGRVSLYEPRGDYQLIVEQVEAAGEGELRRRFDLLKKKLAAEGLFDAERKRALPPVPRRIGVITSPSGAAIRDILTVCRRRFPAIPVIVYPAAVQGGAAVPELIAALERAVARAECDVLIIGRGGGSLEDLWAFNEEAVARAIAGCPIPVVSAVGHEIDFTIADFVADVRAPTPSGAAELVVPDQEEWLRSCAATTSRLALQIRRYLDNNAQALDWLGRRLRQASPSRRLRQQRMRLAALTKALGGAMRHDFTRRGRELDRLAGRFRGASPATRLERASQCLVSLEPRLRRAGRLSVERAGARLRHADRALHAVSPLATLERGYAIVSDAGTGKVLTDAGHIKAGTNVTARLRRGKIHATVNKTETNTKR
jgi:exodeoxyribonuclease VII large subunit